MKTFLFPLLAAFVAHSAHAADKLQAFEPDSFKRIVATGKGKPFVVLVWSLDCEYCQRSFQALAEARKKNGLYVVTIATDPADDAEAAASIRNKLASADLATNMWAFGPAPAERLRYAIDPKWRGEIPRSYWFDKDGKAVAHSGMITPATVAKLMPR